MNNEQQKIYICPMHPEVREEKPGFCPDCGMNLVPSSKKAAADKPEGEQHKGHGGHEMHAGGFDKPAHVEISADKHAGHSTNIFKAKFWASLILTVPVVLYSGILDTLFGWSAPKFSGSEYLPLSLSSIIFFYGGWVFLISAWRELRAKLPGMMTLISVAIVAAYAYSIYAELSGEGEALFWELATLITIMLLGHWMEMRAVQSTQGALKELSKLLPDTAEVVRGSGTAVIPLSELTASHIVLVKPGGKIPADGKVMQGISDVNEALATGESKPVPKKEGDEVIAGTINGDGSLKIQVTKIGEATFLAGVMRLVKDAQASKSRLQILSDKAAFYLTVIAILTGGVTLAAWISVGAGISFAMERFVAVLVIACPHALGLAVPLVASISTTKAAKNGFLVRERLALEAARKIDVVLFDKTGTLTKGEYGVTVVWPSANSNYREVIQIAASVNAHSEHPIGKATIKKAYAYGVMLSEVPDFARIPGKGVSGTVEGKKVFVGGEAILEHAGAAVPEELAEKIKGEGVLGRTVNYVVHEKEVIGVIVFADVIRDESRAAIRDLKAMGVRVAMVTGDSEGVAKWVSKELGIDEYFARVVPGEKAEKVKLLQSKGGSVAMVGDGVNDAPALTQANVGIAIGAGTNVAIESAGIILVKNDPRDIVKLIRLSRMTYGKMIQNLFWATGYNVVAIPLAAGALAPYGLILEPAFAAVLMSLSTVIVAVNALFLKRKAL